MNQFSYTTAHEPDCVLITLTGPLDIRFADEFKPRAVDLADTGLDLVFDLTALTGIDSSGLTVFIAAYKRASQHGRRVRLVAVPPFVARIMTVTSLDQLIEVTHR
ncbi:hypothetical protein GCM10010174_65800 [Kutzneria viridogrisea]|uniref:Anti-sigma factor antagonist n=2 Tax=Kutzneria TaxID=43356 RepID=W5W8D7_9PSEU|nr:STAS domain-containing protein [Kutzneria albida]AHH97157.1 hypothetical protein KALB_3793 [Kutzneria albida DSM 43870]MBA8931872.1 anti-anti-sigma factor [Kutzneria viridogrisea]